MQREMGGWDKRSHDRRQQVANGAQSSVRHKLVLGTTDKPRGVVSTLRQQTKRASCALPCANTNVSRSPTKARSAASMNRERPPKSAEQASTTRRSSRGKAMVVSAFISSSHHPLSQIQPPNRHSRRKLAGRDRIRSAKPDDLTPRRMGDTPRYPENHPSCFSWRRTTLKGLKTSYGSWWRPLVDALPGG